MGNYYMNNKSFNFQNNSFDSIRYFSAFGVMFLHYTYYAITISGQGVKILRPIRRFAEFFPGVIILFSLSGFLIAASFERCKTKKEFFIKRVFRLYPELWICTIINFIVIIILAKEQLDGSIIVWLITQILGIANTPSCLKTFATGSINGALWTIFTEIQLYIFAGFMYNYLKKLKKMGWIIFLNCSLVLNLSCYYLAGDRGGIFSKIIERTFFPYLIWFLIGMLCYQKRDFIVPILQKYLWLLFIIFVINQSFNLCTQGYYEDIVTGILLPLITIGLAYVLPAKRVKCDLSYGIFLYHWIVINIMVHLDVFLIFPWYVCVMLFVIVTLSMAWMSWYFVGRKVKLKV